MFQQWANMLAKHAEHEAFAEPVHGGVLVILPDLLAGLGESRRFVLYPLGGGELLEIGVNGFEFRPLAGLLLVLAAAFLGLFACPGLLGFLPPLTLGRRRLSPLDFGSRAFW